MIVSYGKALVVPLGTMAEHVTHNLQVQGPNPATGTEREIVRIVIIKTKKTLFDVKDVLS